MNLISMKQSNKSETGVMPAYEEPEYPYGLCLDLNDESLKKLGFTTPPAAGTEVMITARAYISRSSIDDTQDGGKRISMGLQITDMDISAPGNDINQKASLLYGGTD